MLVTIISSVIATITVAAASSRTKLCSLGVDDTTKELCDRVLTTQGLPEFEAHPVRDVLSTVHTYINT